MNCHDFLIRDYPNEPELAQSGKNVDAVVAGFRYIPRHRAFSSPLVTD
jgi:hypothetical protein